MNTHKMQGIALSTVVLLSLGLSSGYATEVKANIQGKDSLSPQEYFSKRIHMESGQPAVKMVPELYDELDVQRAVQAYVWATPFVSMSAMLKVSISNLV